MPFTRTVTVRFDEADPAGILFYGRILELAHRVFEEFVVSEVVGRWEDWFRTGDFIVPIRHAEATYSRPMRPGKSYLAELAIVRLGESSFEVRTVFLEPDTGLESRAATDGGTATTAAGSAGGTGPAPNTSRVCAETRVAHVFTDPRRMQKVPIPSAVRARLEQHLLRE